MPAVALALIGVLSHLLLDFITPYGTRLFLPFSNARLAWDIFPVLDMWLMPVILVVILMPFFFRLISSEIGASKTSFRPAAITVLIFFAILGAVRITAHRRALSLVDSFVYRGREPVRASAFPESASAFRWHVVIDTQETFEQIDVDVFQPYDPTLTRSMYPPEPHPADRRRAPNARGAVVPRFRAISLHLYGVARGRFMKWSSATCATSTAP